VGGKLLKTHIGSFMKMIKLPIFFLQLTHGFREWLNVQGYAPNSVYNLPNHLTEFLGFLQQLGQTDLQDLHPDYISQYVLYLRSRPHKRTRKELSPSYINKHLNALKNFSRYLWAVHQINFNVQHQLLVSDHKTVTILSEAEIQLLYKTAQKDNRLGLRDQVMLEVYYACGLRRSEGTNLNIEDIDLNKGYLVVRKSKTARARLVPFTNQSKRLFAQYLQTFHSQIVKMNQSALLVNLQGNRIQGQSLIKRLHYLQQHSSSIVLAEKHIGLHSLRHSVATHLLKKGMSLGAIARFLGHSSLESTQIYTQLAYEDIGSTSSQKRNE